MGKQWKQTLRQMQSLLMVVGGVLVLGAAYALSSSHNTLAEEASTSFTFVHVPDTQQEVLRDDNPLLPDRYSWIAANKDNLNVKFVEQTGDLVNWGVQEPAQFTRASKATEILDNSGIPYGYSIGNHDGAAVKVGGSAAPGNVHDNLRNTALFNQTFPVSRFKNVSGTFEPNKVDNMYQTFSAGGVDWLVISHEMWPRQTVLDWMKQVISTHPNHNVIIATHAFTNEKGELPTAGNYGDQNALVEWNQVVSQYANVKFVVSGHYGTAPAASYTEMTGVHGNKVAAIMTCYHAWYQDPMRLLKIDTAKGTISSQVYVPTTIGDTTTYPSGFITDPSSNFVATNMNWVRPIADITAPSVALTAPTNGTTTTNKVVSLKADAADAVGVTNVEFYADGLKVGEDATTPFTYDWDATALPAATHTLSVKAYDAAGNVGTSTDVSITLADPAPDTTAPTVSVTAPANGTSTSDAAITVQASATDAVGVTKVEFYVDGTKVGEATTAPYSYAWTTTGLERRAYVLSVKAYDAAGNVGTSTENTVTLVDPPVTPSDTTAPVVSLTSPVNGTSSSETSITLKADASDDTAVTKVEFYIDATKVGEDTTSPYTYDWNTNLLARKAYTLSVKAYDAAGNVGTSTENTVTLVQPAPPADTTAPTVKITAPTTGTTSAEKIVSLKADATDAVGVTKVEFYIDGVKVNEDTTAPYAYDWDTTVLGDKTYNATAKAYDAAGNVATTTSTAITLDAIFKIAVVPDTTQEVGSTTVAQLNARYQWLVAQRSALDLRFVNHTGNLVNGGVADPAQFTRGSSAVGLLDTAKIPYAQATGPHDTAAVTATGAAAAGNTNTNLRNTTAFNKLFPKTRLTGVGGVFETGKVDNMYQTFSAGGTTWMVLTLETWPRPAVITWAKSVVAANPKINVIINTTGYLSANGTLSTSASFGNSSPSTLWSQLVSQYPNVKLVTTGYNTGSVHVEANGVSGNRVSQILTSYKSNTQNQVRLLEINTKTGTIQSSVYVSRDTTGAAPKYLTDASSAFTVNGMQWVR